jgi:protein-disulfide isomerase
MKRPLFAVLTAALALAPCFADDAAAETATPAPVSAAPAVKTHAKGAVKTAHKLSREELAQALDENPELVVDALLKIDNKEIKSKFFEFIMDSQKAYQATQEERELQAAIKNPFNPKIDDKTRVQGDKKAPITLVEYSDFECPFCGPRTPNGSLGGYKIVEALQEKYGKRLRFVYKHMPLVNLHPQAMPAARWQEAVALQSPEKAWVFHDRMFENQDKLGDAKTADAFFRQTVKDLGLDVKKAEADQASAAVQDKIDADMKEGESFGFSGTPGFLLNGVAVRGAYPPAYFDMIVGKLGLNGAE